MKSTELILQVRADLQKDTLDILLPEHQTAFLKSWLSPMASSRQSESQIACFVPIHPIQESWTLETCSSHTFAFRTRSKEYVRIQFQFSFLCSTQIFWQQLAKMDSYLRRQVRISITLLAHKTMFPQPYKRQSLLATAPSLKFLLAWMTLSPCQHPRCVKFPTSIWVSSFRNVHLSWTRPLLSLRLIRHPWIWNTSHWNIFLTQQLIPKSLL